MFDCWYLADVDTFTFDGDTVTTKLTDGSEQTHTYEYLGSYQLGEGEMMTYGGETLMPPSRSTSTRLPTMRASSPTSCSATTRCRPRGISSFATAATSISC